MGTKRKSQKKEKKRKKIKQKLFAKLPTERQNHCRRELGGFGGVDTFRVATKEAHLLFLFGLFVCFCASSGGGVEEEEDDYDDDEEKGVRSCIVAKKRIPAEFFCFSLNSFFVLWSTT